MFPDTGATTPEGVGRQAHASVLLGYQRAMRPLEVTQAGVWVTVLLLVLVGVVLVVAAFLDRTRGREIARDLSPPRDPSIDRGLVHDLVVRGGDPDPRPGPPPPNDPDGDPRPQPDTRP